MSSTSSRLFLCVWLHSVALAETYGIDKGYGVQDAAQRESEHGMKQAERPVTHQRPAVGRCDQFGLFRSLLRAYRRTEGLAPSSEASHGGELVPNSRSRRVTQ